MKKFISGLAGLFLWLSASAQKETPNPYRQLVTQNAITQDGFFKVHQIGERYYFEIPDSILDRDIIIVNRISKSAAEVRNNTTGFAGDEIGQNLIRFSKGNKNNLYLIKPSNSERSDNSPNGMSVSLANSSVQPLTAAFPIKAINRDVRKGSENYVIDVTEQITGDNDLFYFSSGTKSQLNLGGQMQDRSYVMQIRAFEQHIELKSFKTYTRMGSAASYELNSSMLLLPKKLMRKRFYDERIGFMNTSYTDFDANPQGIKKINIVSRWRLEPKPKEVQKYLKGELVEPNKPIIFYIDPTTPQKWVKYLIQGVNDWKPAFEKAGFKNAIFALKAPSDSTWRIEDAAHSAIVYKPSATPNAFGAEIVDPRSGEILEAHINWHHNIMKLLHDWYMIQAGATDIRARKAIFDDELMGSLIRGVVSHEVGHTLGLSHNYGSSSTVPVDSLRDAEWVGKNGLSPSIMDYARYNYVAQPGDKVGRNGMMMRIGDYDQWAIQWGYRWFPPAVSALSEREILDSMTAKAAKNNRLRFGSELLDEDPSNQSEDLGDDAALAGKYGIANLKLIMPNILKWYVKDGEDYDNAKNTYTELLKQYNQYLWHAAKNIGGVYIKPKKVTQSGAVFSYVPAEKQRNATNFLIKEALNTPKWLVDTTLAARIGMDPVREIKNAQIMLFARLFTSSGMANMIQQGEFDKNAYKLQDFLFDIKNEVWKELQSGQPVDIYKRNLQTLYIDVVSGMSKAQKFPQNSLQIWQGLPPMDKSIPDISSIFRAHLVELRQAIENRLPAETGMDSIHFADMSNRIKNILESNR